mgnify:CR=1 FL=1
MHDQPSVEVFPTRVHNFGYGLLPFTLLAVLTGRKLGGRAECTLSIAREILRSMLMLDRISYLLQLGRSGDKLLLYLGESNLDLS